MNGIFILLLFNFNSYLTAIDIEPDSYFYYKLGEMYENLNNKKDALERLFFYI